MTALQVISRFHQTLYFASKLQTGAALSVKWFYGCPGISPGISGSGKIRLYFPRFQTIERYRLMGAGIGYIDAHLLASVSLAKPASLLTHDKRLGRIAAELAF